jgi:N-acyl-D-amino-acid deacylase
VRGGRWLRRSVTRTGAPRLSARSSRTSTPPGLRFWGSPPLAWLGRPTGEGHPHPRSYGAFPRVFARYVREKGLLTLEEAVHKMTGKPARKLGLDRRGELKEGCFADVVVFDPATIQDRATFEQPHQFAEGVHWVIADGHITLDRGTLASQLVGRVLTPAA